MGVMRAKVLRVGMLAIGLSLVTAGCAAAPAAPTIGAEARGGDIEVVNPGPIPSPTDPALPTTPAPSPTTVDPSPTTTPEADSKYTVSITDTSPLSDSSGAIYMLATFSVTNTTADPVSFLIAFDVSVVQGDEELSPSLLVDSEIYRDRFSTIEPGTTADIVLPYQLVNSEPVTIEVRDRFPGTLLATGSYTQ